MLLSRPDKRTALSTWVLGGYLLTEAELGDDLTVSIYVFTIKVVKKTAALTNHFQQAASAAVVVFMLAQMFR